MVVAAALPASAQVDFSGNWAPRFHEDQPERVPGPEVGDYLALPSTDPARAHGQAWSASLLTLPEHQCKPHPVGYGYRGPSNMRVQQEIDPLTQRVVKITVHLQWMEQFREIWMDGRPHPPAYAPHTWQGFSTGKWEGDTLVVTTTHMKQGWVRRNGIWYSDYATFTDRFTRHGDVLSHVAIMEDPLILTEPYIRTTNWVSNPSQVIEPYPCTIVDEVAGHQLGQVPHYLPGTNTMLNDFARKFGLNPAWAEGGAHTMYPEFRTLTRAPAPARPITRPAPPSEIKVQPVQGNVYMLVGAGANVAVQVGPDGVLVVDTGAMAASQRLLAAIGALAPGKTIRYVVNTSADAEHTGGNTAVASAGETATGGDVRQALGANSAVGAVVIAHENAQAAMVRANRDVSAWPTETFFTAKKEIFFNGEGIQILHAPNAHGDADVMVYFRKSDVLVAGELFSTDTYPIIGEAGTINGIVTALNQMIDISIPREKQEGGTFVIPGRGRVVDEAEIVDYRDMLTIIRDRVQDMARKRMTLEQVLAARPAYEYDDRWSGEGAAASRGFIEAAYRSLRPRP